MYSVRVILFCKSDECQACIVVFVIKIRVT